MPTLDGVQLGDYNSQHPDVEGTCHCFLGWKHVLMKQLPENRKWDFGEAAEEQLTKLAKASKLDADHDICWAGAPNTLDRRKIAYEALMRGLLAICED
jgi:hypothetical protein